MSATPQDVQAKLDAAVAALKKTTVGYLNNHWKTPPAGSNWAIALDSIQAARDEAGQLVAPVTPPPPPPPPTPPPAPSGDWAWDATSASVDPNSASLVASFLNYSGTRAYLQVSVGAADAAADSPGYSVPVHSYGSLDATVYIPAGTKPGMNDDHHLTIRDTVHGREHDMWHATLGSDGRISGCDGGQSMPLGAIQESAGNSNAAGFPLRRGLVTLADLAAGAINHPLVFSMANVGPPPGRFPAVHANGYPGNTGFPLGTWLRLDPSVSLIGMPAFDLLFAQALQRYGAFCRDIGSDLSFYAQDDGGGAQTLVAWKNAVPGLTTDSVGCPIYKLSSGFPWDRLQVLVAPTS